MDKSSTTDQQYLLPDMCRAISVLYVTLVAQLLAIILALNTSFIAGNFWTSLSLNALFILWVAFVCSAIFCGFKKRINKRPAISIILFMFFTINVITLLMTWVITFLLPQFELFIAPAQGNMSVYLRNGGISVIFSIILLRFLYIQHQWRRQTKAESEARLDALQARIRPHFLFNSLNTIASLTRIDPPLAESLTEDLAELFRANMQSSKRLVPFEQELTLVQQYLNIEQLRLGDRLTINIDVSTIPDDALIPPLSIQPLIENAIYHGIEPLEKGGKLEVLGRIENNKITLLIKNPLSDEALATVRPGHHMAIDNIRLRMQNCFPNNNQLLVSSSESEFQTQLKFPYQTEPA
ncbi:MAG: signal transduction protein [Cycloclasticus sp.]|nr:MAG: signal transduction protein [Cycloclasticus sp.]